MGLVIHLATAPDLHLYRAGSTPELRPPWTGSGPGLHLDWHEPESEQNKSKRGLPRLDQALDRAQFWADRLQEPLVVRDLNAEGAPVVGLIEAQEWPTCRRITIELRYNVYWLYKCGQGPIYCHYAYAEARARADRLERRAISYAI